MAKTQEPGITKIEGVKNTYYRVQVRIKNGDHLSKNFESFREAKEWKQEKDKAKKLIPVPIKEDLSLALEVYMDYSADYRRDDVVFITREGNPIFRTHFYHILKQASQTANLGFTPTFKMIQWAYVAECIKKDKSDRKIIEELKLKKIPNNLES